MAKIDFPKKQEQRLIPKYLLEYSEELQKNHPDPSAEWGSSGTEYTAGTGINITDNTISIDNTVETKANATNRFVSKANLTDYSINHIIVGNSEIDNDNFDLRAVYSQDVKSEISADPTSIIARTMSGTDVSTIGVSATEIDLTTSMLKYNAHEVATKNDIPDVSEFITDDDLSQALEDYELKSEAFSGSYNDLTDKPTIPTKTSDLQNDSGFITGITSNMITSALGYTPGTSNFSGDYDDLTNKPTIPTKTSDLTNDSGFITSASLSGYVPFETVSGMSMVNTGSYYGPGYEPGLVNHNMLTHTTNTFKLPIDKSGTIALTSDIPSVPTTVSSFTNDAGYITASVSTLTNYYDKTYIDNTVGDIETLLAAI